MRFGGKGWAAAAVLAVAAGVGISWWLTPRVVVVPTGADPSAETLPRTAPRAVPLPAPTPAPPTLAALTPGSAPDMPPGVAAEQWQKLRAELPPAELRRVAEYLAYSHQMQQFRAARGSGADLRPLALALESGLPARLQRGEVSAGEARLIKLAVLQVLQPDEASRQAALAAWQQTLPPATGDTDTEFQRQQAAIVAAWSAQPVAQRDPRALERELNALRQAHFKTPGGTR